MVFPREVCYHLCSSTFTQMTNQYTRTLGVSSTQDDLCIATQDASFEKTESTLSAALDSIGEYYEKNHLRANPDKTQTCVFPPQEQKSEQTAEHIMVWKETGTYLQPQSTWELLLTEHLATALTSRK